MDSTFKPSLTTISIGPGIRGIERGIENSGTRLDHIAYVEIEALIIENLVSEMEKGLLAPAIIWSDGKTFPAELFRGKVNLLLAGYPCQPFSHAGMRKGTEDPRHLYPYIERTIDIIRPHAVFLENVRGHITLGLREVIASLEGLGYRVRWGIFSAEETGASHKRERVFILAIREECLELSSSNGRESIPTFKSIRDEKRNCTPSEGRWQNIECGIVSTSQLADSEIKCRQQSGIAWKRWNGFTNSNSEIISNDNYKWELQSKRIIKKERRRIIDSSSMGNANISRPQGWISKKCRECTYEWTSGQNGPFCPEQSVARPGQRQYNWESPRTTTKIKSRFCESINGHKNGIDFFCLNEKYEIYTSQKERAIKELSELWRTIEKEYLQWTFGRLFNFLKEKILFSKMYGEIQNQRLSILATIPHKILLFTQEELRKLWNKKIIEYSSQGQESIQQFAREFADAMCLLSYQITLARRQETHDFNQEELLYMWSNWKNQKEFMPETLPAIQEIWRCSFDEEKRWQRFKTAYESYRLDLFDTKYEYNFREDFLRALGNSVYADTAELAWVTLWDKMNAQ